MEKLTFIYFGNDWFGENRTSSHHIADRLSREYFVLYVECPGLRMPKGNRRDLKKLFKKIAKSCEFPQKISENLFVYTLFQIPLHRYAFIRKVNEKIILFSLRRLLRKFKMEKPVLWFHIPHLAPIANKLNSSGIVYYCIDNYSALPNVDKQSIQSMDYKMTEISDLVFVSSSPLFETKKNVAKDLIFSPHGVDFEHFNKSFNHHGIEKRIKSTVTRPVIGFWGLIEDRIDLELIKYLALKHQGWDFAMIGHVAVDDNPCSELSNVKFFGPKKYQELPEFANNFDLLILPYKNNEFVYNCNPIKLREYLATGKPVVSTYYPEIESYREFVGVANTYEEFSEWIQWFFENDNPELAMRRVDKVKGESWESRVEQIIETLHLKFNRNINHG